MTEWKLTRVKYGDEEYKFKEGDKVTIGRAVTNTITLSSIVISRKHCVIDFLPDKIVITDTGSSNGVYVGLLKIPRNSPHEIHDSEIIGIGWTLGAFSVTDKLKEGERYMFKLSKVNVLPIIERLMYQSENELDEIEADPNIAPLKENKLDEIKVNPNIASLESSTTSVSPVLNSKLPVKRKIEENPNGIKTEIKEEHKKCRIVTIDEEIVNLLSDSEPDGADEVNEMQENVKLEPISEENHNDVDQDQIKSENEYLEYEAFNVKQEYMGYDDEPINIESDSDGESEQWLLRLSQSSPGKPFTKSTKKKSEENKNVSSYSQLDDNVIDLCFTENDEEEFMDDIITIPPLSPSQDKPESLVEEKSSKPDGNISDVEELEHDIISLQGPVLPPEKTSPGIDKIDGAIEPTDQSIVINTEIPKISPTSQVKKAQMIEPQYQSHRSKSKHKSENKSSHSVKDGRIKKQSSKKRISNSQKEERKQKLKEIAKKPKETEKQSVNSSTSLSKIATNVKITNINRGAFLTSTIDVLKPAKKKDEPKVHKPKEKSLEVTSPGNQNGLISPDDRENKKNQPSKSDSSKKLEQKHSKDRHKSEKSKKKRHSKSQEPTKALVSREPFKDLNSSEAKNKQKKVRFSDTPVVVEFEIEPGNVMKKTSSTGNLTRAQPKFSLDRLALINILRWNPRWLEEQINSSDPPPLLGEQHGPPSSMLHSFTSHSQYVEVVGNMLLIEIWECLTLAYMKIREQNNFLEMRIESLPPMPQRERYNDLFSFSVNISLPSQESKKVPRVGEILIITFGPQKMQRFFYVHNVRCLPSPPNNIHSFYSIGLHMAFTDKMRPLRPGEVIHARPLAYISKELNLFEAMEYLSSSPLKEVILAPKTHHFEHKSASPNCLPKKWTHNLNPSQKAAVSASVEAALGDKPAIQMVQGPPGTGKSSVICAIVMSYFYNEASKRQPHRGKVLICATSNAAVDELVIRLLNIRQSLPKSERFRMVRVGRTEAMAARARDVSSQQLAQRDAARTHASDPPQHHAHTEEIALLEAKLNMWKSCAGNAKDAVRAAYCDGRAADLQKRIAIVMKASGGGGEEQRPEQLVVTERRIIEGADIVVTTLASAYSHKMKGLHRRIALCIIDEAGQAIEPETLLPLTLNVTKLTLIGDPQQLPGYICSQRAKKLGLGESLFSRLSSISELWERSPVALLNQQYRMQADIADYPNRAFYGGEVVTSAPERPLLPIPPYTILTISSGDKGQGPCGGNEMEAWGVSRLVHALKMELSSRSLSLAVITPYHAHKELIKKNLRILMGSSEPPVEVNTVDSFQGQERDVVVVSLARSHGVGFLTDTGRMNVMLTRAKHALVVCLNPNAVQKNNLWQTLLDDAQNRRMWRILPHDMCQPVAPGQTPKGDILKYIKPMK